MGGISDGQRRVVRVINSPWPAWEDLYRGSFVYVGIEVLVTGAQY